MALRAPLGTHLRFARIAAGYSYEDAARVVGLRPATIRGYELGHREPPTLVTLRLIRAYGATPDDVLNGVILPAQKSARAVRGP